MKKHWNKIVIVSLAVLTLVGCAKKPNSDGSDFADQNSNPAMSGPQAYAYGTQNGWRTDASGRRVNPMTAPANQSYYFSYDDNTMRPQDVAALNIQATYLASHPNASVRLEGNTDSRGSREYNIGLGWRRDQTVQRASEQQGVSANQVKMLSFGKEHPIALGNTEQAYSLNRRVDLIYTSGR